ncbi:MAG: indole-3-glycerol phosphate synthase TrpC [Rhizomicrobium sp.]
MTILDRISAYKRHEVAAAKSRLKPQEVEAMARDADPVRGFQAALEAKRNRGEYGLIGEVKKASPSKGLIRADFDATQIAQAYEAGGAACLSVLTDIPSFQGSPEFLALARRATSLPVLRKDFMLEAYQVAEARSWGADAILIILAMVDDGTAEALMEAAARFGMDALVEVHDEDEMTRAAKLQAPLIGINNRNLKSFVTDLSVTHMLAPRAPGNAHLVAESGFEAQSDLKRLAQSRVTSLLVGESLLRQTDIEAATRRLLEGGFPQ